MYVNIMEYIYIYIQYKEKIIVSYYFIYIYYVLKYVNIKCTFLRIQKKRKK